MANPAIAIACLAVGASVGLSAALTPLPPTLAYLGLVGVGLGAAAGLDDEAAEVTDATPTSVRRRTLTRLPTSSAALLTWLSATALLRLREPDWPYLSGLLIGMSVAVAAFGAAALARKHGNAVPGEPVGTAVGLLVLVLLFAEPTIRGVGPFGPLPAALWWWTALSAVGMAALALGTRDRMLTPRAWHR